MKPLQFAGGGGGSSSKTVDSIIGSDNVEVIVGISQGPIKGLKDGPKTFLLDDTPLVNTDGSLNFQNVILESFPGDASGHTITPSLGGFASPIQVNQVLASSTPVVRNGEQNFVDAVDYRIVISALYKSTSKGTDKNNLQLKFEWKRVSDVGWTPAWGSAAFGDDLSGSHPGNGAHASFAMGANSVDLIPSFDGDRQLVTSASGAPAFPPGVPSSPATGVSATTTVWIWSVHDQEWNSASTTNHTGYKTYDEDGTNRRIYTGGPAPLDARVGDKWRQSDVALLVWNGSAWVIGAAPNVNHTPAHALANGVWSITEKVTSPLSRNIRIFIPKLEEKIQLRVTKLTAEDTTELFSSVAWETIIEIQRSPMTFYSVALAHLTGQATDQFTSLPVWNGIYEGRIVKVPSNYDEVARTYTGVWDGTYKLAYTTNTAFIFQDFVENDQYGLSSLYPHVVNKFKIYEWGQNNDVMVPRMDTTLRPRWTYNDFIDQPRDARELAQFICGSAAAVYVDDGNGIVDVLIDKDYSPVALFTRENVGEDGFEYAYTDRQSRANEVTVSFINPALNWQADKRIVRDADDITTYGRIPASFIAAGCIDVDEAIARARRRLITNLTEKEFVTFTTNRKGRYLSEWDMILVCDEDMGTGLPRRVSSVTGARALTVRDAITFEAGFTYVANFDVVNPAYPATSTDAFTTVQRTITNGAGTTTALTFSADLPTLAEYAAFSIEADGLLGFPKPYKITKIDRQTGDPDRIVITALEVNRNKSTYIDTAVDLGEISYSSFTNTKVLPPRNPNVTSRIEVRGAVSVRVLTLTWEGSLSPWVRDYTISHSVGGALANTVTSTDLSIDFEGAATDVHTFSIIANDVKGLHSDPVSISYDVVGEIRALDAVLNFQILDSPAPNESDSVSPRFSWDAPSAPDPGFAYYQVQIFDNDDDTLRRTENNGVAQTYTYDWTKQVDDCAGTPDRTFRIEVRTVDQFGGFGSVNSLVITNPSPGTPSPAQLTPTIGGFNMAVPVTSERDVIGLLIWVSPTSGFDPTAVFAAYDGGQGNTFYVAGAAGTTQYVRAAYYDPYGQDDLNISAEQDVTVETTNYNDLSTALKAIIDAGGTTAAADAAAAAASAAAAAASDADAVIKAGQAQTAATAALASQTAAATSAGASASSATAAATSSTNAGNSATAASGSATTATNQATAATGSATAAAASATAAASSNTAAGTSATAAATSASSAATSATAAGTSATAANASAVSAASSNTAAGTSATAAAGSASSASTSATNAGNSATAAAASAVTASTGATNASNSATAAATSASAASTSATNASTSASAASTSATSASTSAGTATTQATNAANSATSASGSATTAATSATTAANSATTAAGSATAAATSATNAATSATTAGTSAASATAASTAASLSAAIATYVDPFAVYSFTGSNNNGWTATTGTLTAAATKSTWANTGAGHIDKTGVSFAGSRFTRVIIDLKRTVARTGGAWQNRLYWSTGGHGVGNVGFYTAPLNDVDLAVGQQIQFVYDFVNPTAGGVDWTTNNITGLQLALDTTTGGSFEIYSIKVVGPDATAIATSAAAAATSATNAATSATTAGTQATAAATSATTATTQAGNASTSATASSTSATAAAGSATQASTSATLAANIGNQALSANSVFADWGATTFPTSWVDGTNGAANTTKVTGQISPNAMKLVGGASTSVSNKTPVAIMYPGYYVLEADVKLVSGGLTGSGLKLLAQTAASGALTTYFLNFATDLATNDLVIGAGTPGVTYRFRKLIQVTDATSTNGVLSACAHDAGIGSITSANSMEFERVLVRAAASTEIAANRADANAISALANVVSEATARANADTAITNVTTTQQSSIDGHTATLSSQAATIALHDGRLQAFLEFVAAAGSDPAFVQMNANGLGSSLGLGATAISLLTPGRATGQINFSSFPAANDTVTVNGVVITWKASGATGNQVNIGASAAASAANLATFLTNSVNASLTPAQYGANGAVVYVSYKVSGTGGNSFTLAESSTATTVSGATLTGGTTQSFLPILQVLSGVVNIAGQLNVGSGNFLLDPVTGTMQITAGSSKFVLGTGFGASANLALWFGPSMAVSAMTKANAAMWFDNAGSAYFGGSLSAGTLTTKAATSSLTDNPTAETAVYGSNGGTIHVVASHTHAGNQNTNNITGSPPSNASGSLSGATLTLWRSINGGAYASVSSQAITGTWSHTYIDNGDGTYRQVYTNSSSASLTYTDPSNLAQNRQYKAVITGGGVGATYHENFANDSQNVSVISTE